MQTQLKLLGSRAGHRQGGDHSTTTLDEPDRKEASAMATSTEMNLLETSVESPSSTAPQAPGVSSQPPDRPSPFALRIPLEVHPGYAEHVTITAPFQRGRRLVVIDFPESQGSTNLVYPVDENLDGAIFVLTSFMLNGVGCTTMEMKPFNAGTGDVDEQFTLATWDVTPPSQKKRLSLAGTASQLVEEQAVVMDQVRRIVGTLFCESGVEFQRRERIELLDSYHSTNSVGAEP